jgi:hypothetical protein
LGIDRALIFLAIGFISGVSALYVVAFSLPTPAVYNRYTTLESPENAGRINSELAESWYRYGLRERALIQRKAFWTRVGMFSVAIALLVLVVAAAVAVFHADPVHPK